MRNILSSLPHFITQMNKEQIWTPRAILSDIDGVVLDGDFKHRDAMNIVAVPLGAKPITDADWMRHSGRGYGGSYALLAQENPGFGKRISKDEFAAQGLAEYAAMVEKYEVPAKDGIWFGYKMAKIAGIPIVAVSNTEDSLVNAGLERANVADLFEFVIGATTVKERGRNPKSATCADPWHLAAEELCSRGMVGQPLRQDECLKIEDSKTGMDSAILAGGPVAQVLFHANSNGETAIMPHHPDATWHLRSGAEIENFFQRAEYSDRRMTLRHSLTPGLTPTPW